MYRSTLMVRTAGLKPEIMALLQGIEPLERFEQQFGGMEAPAASTEELEEALIFTPQAGKSAADLRRIYGKKAYLVCVTDEPEKLTAAEQAALDDIWAESMSEVLWRFHFVRLQRIIAERREQFFYWRCLDTAINMLPDLIWFKDVKGAHLKVNDAFCECVAKEKSDVEGRGHYYIWGLTKEMYDQGEYVCLETEQEVLDKRCLCVFDEQVLDQNGTLRELKTWKSPIFDENGETLIGTVGIARDVTVENEQRRRIEYMAYTDYLTGTANRQAFYRYMEEKRKDQPVTMIYIDVDHFKQVNDTYGHKVGDEALVQVAALMKKHFDKDFVTRLGGDEFLITLLGKHERAEVCERLDDFMRDIRETFSRSEMFSELSVSMGIAQTESPDVWGGELIHNSDMALYSAKKAGRGRYVFYDDLTAEMRQDAAGGRFSEEYVSNRHNRPTGV